MFYLNAPLTGMSEKDLGVAKEEVKEEAEEAEETEEDEESVGTEDNDESSGCELVVNCGPAGYEVKEVEKVLEEAAPNAVLTPPTEPSS